VVDRELEASRRLLRVNEWELQRILLDIHDGPVQAMYAALSQLDRLDRLVRSERHPHQDELLDRAERIRRLLERGLVEVRSFIGAIRPPEFETQTLAELLETLAIEHEATTDTRVTVEPRGEALDLSVPIKIALYRVLQEALSNAYRHGGADRVQVSIEGLRADAGERVVVTVEDNGAGFEPQALEGDGHFGLRGMRDRVELVGGHFWLRSAPGDGTVVRVDVPAR
jgi:signal transduction histidine kinase